MKLVFRITIAFVLATFSLTMSAQDRPIKKKISKARIVSKPPTVVSPRFRDSTPLELKESRNEVIADAKAQKPLVVAEQMPSFPGGDRKMQEFIAQNLKYPIVAQETGLQGRVMLRFVVREDGSISDLTVLRGFDPACDNEAKRVIKAMPKWTAGKQNGVNVPVYYTVPIIFKIVQ